MSPGSSLSTTRAFLKPFLFLRVCLCSFVLRPLLGRGAPFVGYSLGKFRVRWSRFDAVIGHGYNEFDSPTVHSCILPGKDMELHISSPMSWVKDVWIWYLMYLFISIYFFRPNYVHLVICKTNTSFKDLSVDIRRKLFFKLNELIYS